MQIGHLDFVFVGQDEGANTRLGERDRAWRADAPRADE
jgi:hypothetical protein